MNFTPRMATLVLATAFASTLPTPSPAAPPVAPRVVARDERLTGTVLAVDSKTRSFDLLTGVGHALRIRHVRLTEGLSLRIRASDSALALIPGFIVRVQCATTGTRMDASSLEVLQGLPPQGSR